MLFFVPRIARPTEAQNGVVPLSEYADLRLDSQMGSLSVGHEVAKCKILH